MQQLNQCYASWMATNMKTVMERWKWRIRKWQEDRKTYKDEHNILLHFHEIPLGYHGAEIMEKTRLIKKEGQYTEFQVEEPERNSLKEKPGRR